jgi:hypothetical protein
MQRSLGFAKTQMSTTQTVLRVGAHGARLISFHSNKLPSMQDMLTKVLKLHGRLSWGVVGWGGVVRALTGVFVFVYADNISSFLLAPVHPTASRKAGFHIKVTGKISNGYKLVARQDKEMQEVVWGWFCCSLLLLPLLTQWEQVFAVTDIGRAELDKALWDVLRPDLYHARPAGPLNPNARK